MRRSTVLSLPVQLVFPVCSIASKARASTSGALNGKDLALLPNIRLTKRNSTGTNALAYFTPLSLTKKNYLNLNYCYQTVFFFVTNNRANKQECLPLSKLLV